MKKLLKSEVYGSMNSAWMHCSQKTWSTIAAGEKKKCVLEYSKVQFKVMNPLINSIN